MSTVTARFRRAEREALVMPARCRSRSGFVDRVVITDISRLGCRIESCALTMRPGDLVVITPEVLEGLCATVRWTDGNAAGIEFATPLYGPWSSICAANTRPSCRRARCPVRDRCGWPPDRLALSRAGVPKLLQSLVNLRLIG